MVKTYRKTSIKINDMVVMTKTYYVRIIHAIGISELKINDVDSFREIREIIMRGCM